jgi:hypothetical protein
MKAGEIYKAAHDADTSTHNFQEDHAYLDNLLCWENKKFAKHGLDLIW